MQMQLRRQTLKHGESPLEFTRYRRQCTRRLRRLRKKLAVSSPPFCFDRLLMQALLAERAWARAMESKSTLQDLHRSYGHRGVCKRLSKASSHGNILRELSIFAGDYEISRECNAYADWLTGLNLEARADYGGATVALERARVIYSNLAKCEKVQWPSLYEERAQDCSGAMSRSSFAGGGVDAPEASDYDQVVGTPDSSFEGSLLLDWCGTTFKMKAGKIQQRLRAYDLLCERRVTRAADERSGGTVGLCCKPFEDSIIGVASLPNETQYARKLVHLEDILRAIRSDDNDSELPDRSLELFVARVSYEKLDLLYQRCDAAVADRTSSWRGKMLCSSAARVFGTSLYMPTLTNSQIPDDVLHLYDKLIEVTNEMITLTGFRDTRDECLGERLDARTAVLHAYRCHFLAEMFGLLVDESQKAFSLLHRTIYFSGRALQETEACEAKHLSQEMVHLSGASGASLSRLKAEKHLARKQHSHIRKHIYSQLKNTLLNNITVKALMKLAPTYLNPAVVATARPSEAWCRPLLFDLAQTQLTLPCFQTQLRAKSTSRGLFGWFQRR